MLKPGHGLVEIGLGASSKGVGISIDVEARVRKALSAYAEAEAFWNAKSMTLDGRAIGGLRWRW